MPSWNVPILTADRAPKTRQCMGRECDRQIKAKESFCSECLEDRKRINESIRPAIIGKRGYHHAQVR